MTKRIISIFFTLSCTFSFAQIPTDNLVLHLPMNGTAEDLSANELDGIVLGADLTTNRFDQPDSAYFFDGISNYIFIDSDPAMELEFPFSVSLWFYRDEAPASIETLFKSDGHDDIYSGFWISMSAAGEIVAVYGDGLGFGAEHRVSKRSSGPVSVGEWHHVLAVFNGLNDIDLYIDCELDPGYYSGSGTSMNYLGLPATIGKYDWRKFNGKIDDLRVYDDAINEEELDYFCEEGPCVDYIYIYDTISIYDTIHVYDTLTFMDTVYVYDTITFVDTIYIYDTIHVNGAGVETILEQPKVIKIYPNPSSQFIHLDFNALNYAHDNYSFEIIESSGKVVYSGSISSGHTQVDLSSLSLAKGVYLIKVVDGEFRLVDSTKFIFQ